MSYGLIDICKKMLDNADMVVDLSSYPKVSMSFVVHGSVDGPFWEVIFEYEETVSLNIKNENDITLNDLHLVLEVNVSGKPLEKVDNKLSSHFNDLKPELVWFIDIHGHIPIELACGKFNWRLNKLSSQQYESMHA